jgi:hypothetical protein
VTKPLKALFACCLALSGAAIAQTDKVQMRTIQRAVKGAADKDIQIGIFVNVTDDCQSGPLPTIRLAEPPAHGKVVVKRATVRVTNYKECLAVQTSAYVAFYRSAPDFIGEDRFALEVNFPGGRREIEKFAARIGPSELGPKI